MKAKHRKAARSAQVEDGLLSPVLNIRPGWQWVLTLAGLALMAVAAVANWGDEYLFAGRWQVLVRLPGMPERQYYYFPMWYVVACAPLLLAGLALAARPLRRALARPWRSSKLAVPLATAAFLFALTLVPWEHAGTPLAESGSKLALYLILAGTGFCLFLAGFHERLTVLDSPLERAFERLMAMPARQFALLLFGFTLVLTNLLSLVVFEHLPHVQDSIAQLFQARIFARGKLFLDSPRFPDFFDYTHIINNGRWYSQYPFLHSLLMVPFVLLGVPWLTNPLLGALTVPVIYLLGREVYGERTGRLAGVLACVTPFMFCMSAEFMNGASALLFTTLFVLFYFRTLQAGRWHQALLAGVFIGLVACVRPFTALAVALPFAAYGLYRLTREPGRLAPRFLLMVAAGGAVAGLALVYNRLTNGDFLTFGYVVKWGRGHEIGFGKSGWGEQHTPLRGLVNTGNEMNAVNKFLYEWPLAALLPVLIPFAAGTRRRDDWLLLAWFLCLSGAYLFYWFHNLVFGPRFSYEAVPALILLTVRGGEELGPLLRRTFGLAVSDRSAARFAGRTWAALVALSLVAGLPGLMRAYRGYADVGRQVVDNVRKAGLSNAVVFLQHFGNGFGANRLDLDGDVVYAKDFGPLDAALTLSYPGRQYYYANKDTLRPLGDIRFPGSRLARALGEMAAFLDDTLTRSYASVVWPFADIPTGIEWLDRGADPQVTDFREVSRRIFNSTATLDDYLPMLACWMVGDDREHLRIFSFMDDLQNFVAGEFKFTLLMVTADGTGAVFDISPATGQETVVPEGPTVVPVR